MAMNSEFERGDEADGCISGQTFEDYVDFIDSEVKCVDISNFVNKYILNDAVISNISYDDERFLSLTVVAGCNEIGYSSIRLQYKNASIVDLNIEEIVEYTSNHPLEILCDKFGLCKQKNRFTHRISLSNGWTLKIYFSEFEFKYLGVGDRFLAFKV